MDAKTEQPVAVTIECILIREGGSKVEIDGKTYHFKPSDDHDGRHVCTVTDQDAISRFMAVPEAYRAVGFTAASAAQHVAAAADNGEPEPADDVPGEANAEANASTTEPAPDAPENKPTTLDDLTDAELRAHFELVVGRKANARAKRDTLIDQIKAAKAEAKN